jgi:hypothetical protein
MSLLYMSCMKFPTNRFIRNFCPKTIGIALHQHTTREMFQSQTSFTWDQLAVLEPEMHFTKEM